MGGFYVPSSGYWALATALTEGWWNFAACLRDAALEELRVRRVVRVVRDNIKIGGRR